MPGETLTRPYDPVAFDLRRLPPAFYADPFPTYRMLRETDPVRVMPDGSVFLSRYADMVAVYRDPVRFSSDKRTEFLPKFGPNKLFEHHTTSLIFNDPPLHTRVRRLIAGALTQRVVIDMEPGLVRLLDGLLDDIEARGRFDLIADFAAAIPVDVIGNLLGVPQDARGPLRDWSLAILGALEPQLSPEMLAEGDRAVVDFLAYLETLVADRRRHPGDPQRDVLTRLIQGEGDERLSETELLQNCIFILNAGHETTTNTIGNAMMAMVEWPEARQALIADPALMKPAVEEFLRYVSPVQLGNRISTAEAAIGGKTFPPGTLITLCIGAANRDPAQFPEPDRFDITRWPNRHLAFGFGVHQCVGLSVARLEVQVAVQRFLARFPAYRLDGVPVHGGRARFRGFMSVPMAVR